LKEETVEKKRKPGGQKGNQNARTHGFYSKELDETEKVAYLLAVKVVGLDSEIALMRVKIQSLIVHDPGNIRLINQAANTLAHLLSAKHDITNNDEDSLQAAFRNVYNNIAVPLGLSVESNTLKGLRK
jgi:hypothetical protein